MIIQSLYEYYQSNRAKSHLPEFGFSKEDVHFLVDLSKDGNLESITSMGNTENNMHVPARFIVPAHDARTSDIRSYFIRDKSHYALGIPVGGSTAKKHNAFKKLHKELLSESKNKHIKSFLLFLDRWSPNDFEKQCRKFNIEPETVYGKWITFSVDQQYLHDLDEIKKIWHKKNTDDSEWTTCSVTGKEDETARLHPQIKGIGGQAACYMVSFNKEAFESYNKKQGNNFPVSKNVAHGYVIALNHLLKKNAVKIIDETIVSWSNTKESEMAITGLLKPSLDEIEDEELKSWIVGIKSGRDQTNSSRSLQKRMNANCYILGVSTNKTRLVIDFWHVSTLGKMGENYIQHHKDLSVEPKPNNSEITIEKMLKQTAVLKKNTNVQKILTVQLLNAILKNTPYPESLLISTIRKMGITGKKWKPEDDYIKASIIKACLIRRNINKMIHVSVQMDENEINSGYLLGRMFAVLEKIQKDALGDKINATIRDRFYGSASSKPSVVFPMLIRVSKHHLSKLFKDDNKRGFGIRHEKIMQEIMFKLTSKFPDVLNIQDQGRFAIGYYHQTKEYYMRRGSPQSD